MNSLSQPLTTRQPASINHFGSVTVVWQGAGNYKRGAWGFGHLWQLTEAPEGSIDTQWLSMPVDAIETTWAPDPGLVRIGK